MESATTRRRINKEFLDFVSHKNISKFRSHATTIILQKYQISRCLFATKIILQKYEISRCLLATKIRFQRHEISISVSGKITIFQIYKISFWLPTTILLKKSEISRCLSFDFTSLKKNRQAKSSARTITM